MTTDWSDHDVALFAGGGREELIRISAPGNRLNEIAIGLNQPDPGLSLQATLELRAIVTSFGEPASVEQRYRHAIVAFDAFRSGLAAVRIQSARDRRLHSARRACRGDPRRRASAAERSPGSSRQSAVRPRSSASASSIRASGRSAPTRTRPRSASIQPARLH